jgi:hypothetical protein
LQKPRSIYRSFAFYSPNISYFIFFSKNGKRHDDRATIRSRTAMISGKFGRQIRVNSGAEANRQARGQPFWPRAPCAGFRRPPRRAFSRPRHP